MKIGDRVALSALFLRSIDPCAAKGWPTRYDLGKGTIVEIIDLGSCKLADVQFDSGIKRINVFNLVLEENIYKEAMTAEHKFRGYPG